MSRTQRTITAGMYNAVTDLSTQLNKELNKRNISDVKLMRASGVSQYAYGNIKYDRGFIPNLSTIIALFDALGYKEITIRWEDPKYDKR